MCVSLLLLHTPASSATLRNMSKSSPRSACLFLCKHSRNIASIFMRSAEGLPERGGYQSLIEGDPLRRRPPSSVRSSSHDQNVPPNLNLTQETFPFTLRGESLAAFPPLMQEDVSKLLFSSHPTTTCPFGFSTSSSNASHTQSSL